MSMSPIQKAAMAQARGGQWQLANALELIARAESGQPVTEGICDPPEAGGRMRYLVHARRTSRWITDLNGRPIDEALMHNNVPRMTVTRAREVVNSFYAPKPKAPPKEEEKQMEIPAC